MVYGGIHKMGNFVYIIMAGAIIASGVLFIFTKIKINKKNENIEL